MNPAAPNQPDASSEKFQNHIGKTIVVAGGKGGVGKTFITGLLACLLNARGCRVGILDADFAASCVPAYFGVSGPVSRGEYSFIPPLSRTGIKIISADFFLNVADQKIVWKESLIGNVVKELWYEMEWGKLDFLLVDIPPANSEAAVTILQTLPVSGALMVTMPQGISRRMLDGSIKLFQRMNVPILGLVENMSSLVNPETGQKEELFQDMNGKSLSENLSVQLLASLTFDPQICRLSDSGSLENLPLDRYGDFTDSFLNAAAVVEERITVREDQLQKSPPQEEAGTAEVLQSDSEAEQAASPGPQHQQYLSDTVLHLIKCKENVGVLDRPDGQGLFTGSCGDRMQIDLRVISGRILDARFMADGCGVTYACGTMITKMAFARKLVDADRITPQEVIEALDGLPDDHLHCAELAVMTLREAVIDAIEGHRNRAD